MSQLTISTELIRRLRHHAPTKVTDYRDAKLPGFVLRARPSGIHSWRLQLPNRRWLTLGRLDEVALSDARDTAQQRRAWPRHSGAEGDVRNHTSHLPRGHVRTVDESHVWGSNRAGGTHPRGISRVA